MKYNLKESVFLDFQSPLTWWEVTKMVLLLPLLPVRIGLLLVLLTLVATTNTLALGNRSANTPLPRWRRGMVVCTQLPARLIMIVLGFRVTVKGWENIQKGRELGAIGVFNHCSFADALALFSRLTPTGVARQATATMPFIGRAISALNMIYVPESKRRRLTPAAAAAAGAVQQANGSAEAAPADVLATNGTAVEANGAGDAATALPAVSKLILDRVNDPRYCKPGGFPIVVIAPEGTVTNGRALLPFKAGAFLAGRPVVPILLDYSRNRRLSPAWTEMNLGFHYLRLMSQFVNHLEIRVLPPYIPSDAERANPLLYGENVRQLMAKELKVGLSDDVFANCQKLGKLGIQMGPDGRTLQDPHGVVDRSDMTVDLHAALEKVLAAKAVEAAAKQQATAGAEAKKVA